MKKLIAAIAMALAFTGCATTPPAPKADLTFATYSTAPGAERKLKDDVEWCGSLSRQDKTIKCMETKGHKLVASKELPWNY